MIANSCFTQTDSALLGFFRTLNPNLYIRRTSSMKRFNVALLILGIIGSTNVLADNVCQKNYANLRCGSGIVESIDFRGFVDIEGTTVSNSVNVSGNLDATNAHLNRIHVRGNAYLTSSTATDSMEVTGNVHANDVNILGSTDVVGNFNGSHTIFQSKAKIVGKTDCKVCTFKANATFVGELYARNSDFLGNLLLSTNNSEFYRSKTGDITVKKPSEGQDQTITLKENSIANNITFESGTGLVILMGNSKVKGSVQGGKIITKSA
jgi:hypothetical protein